MSFIALKGFRGAVPRYSNRLLEGNQAQRAWNCRITSGRLDPIKGPSLITSIGALGAPIRTIFRYHHFVNGEPTANWLTWAEDVDVRLSPLANEERGTFYFTSDAHEPRMSNYALAILGALYPNAWFTLGVPSPTIAPTVTPSGGSTPVESRSYAITFVTQFGEESGPSPASAVVAGNTNGLWALSALQTAPPNGGNVTAALADSPVSGQVRVTLDSVFGLAQHETVTFAGVAGMTSLNGKHRIVSVDKANNRVVVRLATAQVYTAGGTWTRESPLNTTGMRKRIYRTAGTNPSFFFTAEIPVAQTTHNDITDTEDLGEVMQTLLTQPPPKNLTCLRMLPNGCAVGLAGNELCFSEPYKIYSWPTGNRYSFSGVGVNIVPAGNSVIVLTDTFPILFTGTDPESMSPSTIQSYAPCVSKRGVADVGGGCVYPSFDGLWLVTPGQAINLTKKLYRMKEWVALNPSSFEAAFFDGQYYAQYSLNGQKARILLLDIDEPDSTTEIDERVDCIYRNEYDGRLYVTQGTSLFDWDADDGFRYACDWMSRTYQFARPTTFDCAQVFAEFREVIPIDTTQLQANTQILASEEMDGGQVLGLEVLAAEVNGSLVVPVDLQTERKVQITFYKKGQPYYTVSVGDERPFRLPTGYQEELFSVQISTSVPMYSFAMASSIDELRDIAP